MKGEKDLEWSFKNCTGNTRNSTQGADGVQCGASDLDGSRWKPTTNTSFSGILPECEVGEVILSLDARSLAARSDVYTTLFFFNSTSWKDKNNNKKKDKEKRLVFVSVKIKASVDASLSSVEVNQKTGGQIAFKVMPRDRYNVTIHDAADVAFVGRLNHNPSGDDQQTLCTISYRTRSEFHDGECELPRYDDGRWRGGIYMLTVSTTAGERVGNGSILIENVGCSTGSYWSAEQLECLWCPEGTICESEGLTTKTIEMAIGVWRETEYSMKIRQCLSKPACKGGVNTMQLCAKGHKGPLCGVCRDGYSQDATRRCKDCKTSRTMTWMIISLCAVLLMLALARKRVRRRLRHLAKAWKLVTRKMQTKAKLAISTYQIISTFVEHFSVDWPNPFPAWTGYFFWLDFDVSRMLSFGCLMNQNFYRELLIMTAFPMVVLLVCFGLNQTPLLRGNMAAPALWFTYILFPSISVKIFSTFDCGELAP